MPDHRPVASATLRIARATVLVVAAIALQMGSETTLLAQSPAPTASTWEFLVTSGAVVPVGDQRSSLKRGSLSAAQLMYLVRPSLALTATLGWNRTRDVATDGAPKLDMFTYDIGGELRAPRWRTAKSISFTPFAGAGVGARSYNYRHLSVAATHGVAAYGSAGGELGVRRVRLRVEARDYVAGVKPTDRGNAAGAWSDVSIMAGLRFVMR